MYCLHKGSSKIRDPTDAVRAKAVPVSREHYCVTTQCVFHSTLHNVMCQRAGCIFALSLQG